MSTNNGMRVNLLKNRKILSEKDYLKEKLLLQSAIFFSVVVVVVTIAIAIWSYLLTQKLKGIEATISEASRQMQGLAEANAEQVYVKNRLDMIGNFLDDQAVARESLQKVLALSLPGVAIGSMSFESKDEILVTVTADSNLSLAEVVNYYEQQDGYFPQVLSMGVSRNKDNRYEIKLKLTLPTKE